jgi:2-isopropylmalate synthase
MTKVQVAGLARTSKDDIDKSWGAIKDAAHPRIHTFIATSDIHLKHKLKMDRDQVVKTAYDSVKCEVSY